jgi:hypothetical protein
MTRSLLLAPAMLASFVAVAALASACSGADDASDDAPRTPSTALPTEPGPAHGGKTADAATATDSGATDAATGTDAAKPKNAFEGAPAFASQTGPSTRQGGHAAKGNCNECHSIAGGAGKIVVTP